MKENKKIATLTFSNSTNFGAVLQTYALQKAILNLGYETEVIDYDSDYIYKPYLFRNIKTKGIKTYILSTGLYITRIPRMRKFEKFRENIQFSQKVDAQSIKKLENIYSAYIVGSDQVWNDKITGFDKNFFLDFVKENSKKCSYAASFGISHIEQEKEEEYKRLIGAFNHLLVREKRGSELIKKLVDRESKIVLDPTLLISKEEWLKLADSKKIKGKYILVYQMGVSSTMIRFVKKLAKEKGCKIIVIPFPLGSAMGGTWKVSCGPEEWLALFRDAEYIVTDSFHGTVFSIKFNKQFFTEVSPMVKQLSSRIDTMLNIVGLKERLIINGNSSCINKEINYDEVNRKLESHINVSLKHLEYMLKQMTDK